MNVRLLSLIQQALELSSEEFEEFVRTLKDNGNPVYSKFADRVQNAYEIRRGGSYANQ